jgi:acetolactate synthase-1/2/3 large subunit
VGDIAAALQELAQAGAPADDAVRSARSEWVAHLRQAEDARMAKGAEERDDARAPLHPVRLLADLESCLDDDAVIVGDGGDVVSYAGRMLVTEGAGSFLEPGPFGCLGAGPGAAIAAKLAHPNRQVCAVFGDGAFGFAGMDIDTMVRLELPVLCIVANNGMWGLEHHPMLALFGYSVTNVLQPNARYDQLATALGAHGEYVTSPAELLPALQRAVASGKPALVNVLTDPSVAYPRSTNLA